MKDQADAAFANQHYADAIPLYSQLMATESHTLWALYRRGECHRLLQNVPAALDDFSKALTLNPKEAWAWARRGACYRMCHRFEEALADLNEALCLKPNYPWALAYRALVHEFLGSYEACLADFSQIPDPQILFTNVWTELAVMSAHNFRYRIGWHYSESALSQDQDQAWVLYVRAMLQHFGEGPKAAHPHIDLARAAWQDDAGPHAQTALQKYRLAGLDALSGHHEEARTGLFQAFQQDATMREYFHNDPVWKYLKHEPAFVAGLGELGWMEPFLAKGLANPPNWVIQDRLKRASL